jgi:hypothetical protein
MTIVISLFGPPSAVLILLGLGITVTGQSEEIRQEFRR